MRLKDVSKILHHDIGKKPADRKAVLRQDTTTAKDDWEQDPAPPIRSRYLMYLTLITFVFFLATAGIAYFVQISGSDRSVSTSKISISTQGASVVDGGRVVPLSVRIANRNPVAIQNVKFVITYPPGTYKKGEPVTRLPTEEFKWSAVKSGEVVSIRIAPLLYGTVGERKELRYYLEYQAEGSSQPTQINETYAVQIRSAPLVISTLRHTTPVAGKNMTLTVGVRHNTAEKTPGAVVELVYPRGFTPTSFSTEPINREKTVWRVKTLRPDEEQIIRITGILQGKESDEQSAVARIYAAPSDRKSTVIAEKNVVFSVSKSFLSVALKMEGNADNRITVSPGDEIEVKLDWKNEDTAQLQNLVITAALSGTGLNESSIRPGSGGYFNEVARQIVWDRRQIDGFTSVAAGGTGALRFRFRALSNQVEFAQAEKTVQISISAQARRVVNGQTEKIQNIAVGRIDLRSVLRTVGNTLYATSSIKNRGPIPPRVGEKTSYVLKYFIKNDGNTLSDVVMRIPLERDVELTGQINGITREEWEYDEDTHTFTVRIPSLAPVGPQSSRLFELQVVIEPTARDVGKEIALTKQSDYEAYDTYVDETFTGTLSEFTSRITAEPLGYRSAFVVESE